MRNLYIIGVAVLLALSGGSCTPTETFIDTELQNPIGFESRGLVTRATEAFPVGTVIGVFAYELADGNWTEYVNPNLMYNVRLTNTQVEVAGGSATAYLYNPVMVWPATAGDPGSTSTAKLKFVAYTPHSLTVAPGAITLTPSTMLGYPEITLEMGKEKGRIDFAVAEVGPVARTTGSDPAGTPSRTENNVNFVFTRKLSEIVFQAKAVNMIPHTKLFLNKVSIRNIYKKAIYNYREDKWTPVADVDGITGATLNLTSIGAPISDTDFRDIVNPTDNKASSILLFPQTYENVELEVSYTLQYLKPDGGCEYHIQGTKKIPLTANWEMSKSYLYQLELAFSEAFGDNFELSLTVKAWKEINVSTTID